MKNLGFLLLFTSLSWGAFAQNNLKPLYFPAEQNNLQILPQRFEYTLLDEDTFKIGDILIDTKSLLYNVKSGPKGLELTFSWPDALIDSGEITIKDNNGKAIFSTSIDKKQVKTQPSSSSADNSELNIRDHIASMSFQTKDLELIETLKYLPFSVFCLNKEESGTKIYLCSKELYYAQENGVATIKTRSARHPKAQISINGKEVGDQGLIYLNSREEDIFFRARSQSGAFLEIETRKQDLTFKDFYIGKTGQEMILTGEGASPASDKGVRKLENGMWQIALPIARPFLYVRGDGNIPMRQEFYVKSSIPKSQYRPFVSKSTPEKTYAAQLITQGNKPGSISLAVDPKSQDQLSVQQNQFSWTLSQLKVGVDNQKNLRVTVGEESYIASYFIQRGYRFLVEAGLSNQASPSQMSGYVNLQGWMSQSWGLVFHAQPTLSQASEFSKLDRYGLEVLWRQNPGLNMIDPSWGLYAAGESLQGEGNISGTALGAGAFYSIKKPLWMSWFEARLGFTTAKIEDLDLTGIQAQVKAYNKITSRLYGTYGLSFKPTLNSDGESTAQPSLELGLATQF